MNCSNGWYATLFWTTYKILSNIFASSLTCYVEGIYWDWQCEFQRNRSTTDKILCFVDRASRYIRVMKTNLMRYLSLVNFVSQLQHVSGISVVHHQEVYCIYTALVRVGLFSWLSLAGQLTVSWKAQHVPMLYIYSLPPDDGLQIYPKHVEVVWRNKLRLNNASSWYSLHGYW
jgi:hypothetical protein